YMSGGQYSVPIVIRGPGGPAAQLAAQHSQSMEVYFYHVPGLKVVRPSTPADAKGLLKSSIRDDNPVIFIEAETLYAVKGEVPDDADFLIPLGQAIVRREGTDVTVVAYMGMMYRAMEAAEGDEHGREQGRDAEAVGSDGHGQDHPLAQEGGRPHPGRRHPGGGRDRQGGRRDGGVRRRRPAQDPGSGGRARAGRHADRPD